MMVIWVVQHLPFSYCFLMVLLPTKSSAPSNHFGFTFDSPCRYTSSTHDEGSYDVTTVYDPDSVY